MNIIKTLFFLILVPGPLLFWAPYKIALSSPGYQFIPGPFRYTTILSGLAGTLFLLWSCWEFVFRGRGTPAPIDPPKVLVAEQEIRISDVLIIKMLIFSLARAAGCAGIVCSGLEVKSVEAKFGQNFIAVTPGIRPAWEAQGKDDQKRITTLNERCMKAETSFISPIFLFA